MRYAVITHGGQWIWTDDPAQAMALVTAHNGTVVDYKSGLRAGQGIIEEDENGDR